MRAIACLLALLLASCNREESFDERYDDAQAEIEAKARELESQLPAGEEESEKDDEAGASGP